MKQFKEGDKVRWRPRDAREMYPLSDSEWNHEFNAVGVVAGQVDDVVTLYVPPFDEYDDGLRECSAGDLISAEES